MADTVRTKKIQPTAALGYEHAAEEMALKRLLENRRFKQAVDITSQPDGRLYLMLKQYADTVQQADGTDYASSSVELITMISAMRHLEDPTERFEAIADILVPGGVAVIEVANYMHARNRIKHALKRKKIPVAPVYSSSDAAYITHNPKTVINQLAHAGLKVERILSVSNLRSTGLSKVMPKSVVLAIEGILQPTLGHSYFGPSVFFLVSKVR